jgi:hypothetical protein
VGFLGIASSTCHLLIGISNRSIEASLFSEPPVEIGSSGIAAEHARGAAYSRVQNSDCCFAAQIQIRKSTRAVVVS